ncbi:MBL fold metallo-hydrolase [Actinomadura flavalba]|uniref:MBL fold metallo-hydrolase n=1 Tax=Actinomadura flavalba TaxID=1120938 RepID=UPI00036C7034|nr:MBL fold metallo-hydrolase [Actinomadura flavalba]
MRLAVLGSATPYPSPDNPCSGYLVSSGATTVWTDAGTGTLGPLQWHVPLAELSAVWISHLHADHCADLLTAYYALLYADVRREAPLPLYAPPGVADRLAAFLTNTSVRSPVEDAFDIHELYEGHRAEIGDLTLTSREVQHGMPAFAVRFEDGSGTLTYSGDTAPCANLVELAKGTDLLLCEADGPSGGARVHHTPEDAGSTAHAAGAARLVVTHVSRALPPERAVALAASRYAGEVTHADPGRVMAVTSSAG